MNLPSAVFRAACFFTSMSAAASLYR